MIKDGNSEGPFSLEDLTAHGLAAETKVWRQGLSQWTEARLVPEFAQIFGVKVVEKHLAADDAVRRCPICVPLLSLRSSSHCRFSMCSRRSRCSAVRFSICCFRCRGCRYAQPLLHAACCAPATLRRR